MSLLLFLYRRRKSHKKGGGSYQSDDLRDASAYEDESEKHLGR